MVSDSTTDHAQSTTGPQTTNINAELEYAALQEKTDTRTQASALCVQHMKDITLDFRWDSQAAMTFDHIRKALSVTFANYSKLQHGLEEFKAQLMSGYGSTPRRLELDLMYLGKVGSRHLLPNGRLANLPFFYYR